MKNAILALSTASCLLLGGCGMTLVTSIFHDVRQPCLYPATALDGIAIAGSWSCQTNYDTGKPFTIPQRIGIAVGGTVLGTCDMAFSLVTDTIRLPLDVGYHLSTTNEGSWFYDGDFGRMRPKPTEWDERDGWMWRHAYLRAYPGRWVRHPELDYPDYRADRQD